jgi:hypothetical protein
MRIEFCYLDWLLLCDARIESTITFTSASVNAPDMLEIRPAWLRIMKEQGIQVEILIPPTNSALQITNGIEG